MATSKSRAKAKPSPTSPNQKLLDQMNRTGTWFHAKKTRPICARMAKRRQTVQSLEGEVEAQKGDYVCRGHAGEKWVQAAGSLQKKYRETDKTDSRGWTTYQPRRDATGVMACQVPRTFTVVATWGTLRGKKNDFLVKPYDDRHEDYPEDVWIVDRGLFEATYEVVETGPERGRNS